MNRIIRASVDHDLSIFFSWFVYDEMNGKQVEWFAISDMNAFSSVWSNPITSEFVHDK
jgi:hypothetical protein